MIDPIFEEIYKRRFGFSEIHYFRPWENTWAVQELGEPLESLQVLDAGAGKSAVPFYLSDCGVIVTTIDNGKPTDGSKEWGFVNYTEMCSKIASHHASFCKMSWVGGEFFDAVLCMSVVEHLKAHVRLDAFREFARVVKPGGKLILTVDLNEDGFTLWNACRSVRVEADWAHGSTSTLIQELRGCGFILRKFERCPLKGGPLRLRVAGLSLQKEGEWA